MLVLRITTGLRNISAGLSHALLMLALCMKRMTILTCMKRMTILTSVDPLFVSALGCENQLDIQEMSMVFGSFGHIALEYVPATTTRVSGKVAILGTYHFVQYMKPLIYRNGNLWEWKKMIMLGCDITGEVFPKWTKPECNSLKVQWDEVLICLDTKSICVGKLCVDKMIFGFAAPGLAHVDINCFPYLSNFGAQYFASSVGYFIHTKGSLQFKQWDPGGY